MKRLQRSKHNRIILGVCGGIAEYMDLDPTIIRVVFILLSIFGGTGVLAYIIGIIIIPEMVLEKSDDNSELQEKSDNSPRLPTKNQNNSDKGAVVIGLVLVSLGVFFLLRRLEFLDGYLDWISYHFWSLLLPVLLLIVGISLIYRSKKK